MEDFDDSLEEIFGELYDYFSEASEEELEEDLELFDDWSDIGPTCEEWTSSVEDAFDFLDELED